MYSFGQECRNFTLVAKMKVDANVHRRHWILGFRAIVLRMRMRSLMVIPSTVQLAFQHFTKAIRQSSFEALVILLVPVSSLLPQNTFLSIRHC